MSEEGLPYWRGHAAYLRGAPITANIFSLEQHPLLHEGWAKGWKDAYEQAPDKGDKADASDR